MAFEWKGVVAGIAPTVARTLNGPLSGLGLSALSGTLLGRADGKEEEVVEALRTLTPEVAGALKKAEQQLQEQLQELGIDLAAVDRGKQKDTAAKEVAGTSVPAADRTPRMLAVVVLAGFFVSVAYVFLGKIQPEVAGVAGTLIGYVSAKADTVVAYYFGSSAGSAEKNRMLEQAFGKAAGQVEKTIEKP